MNLSEQIHELNLETGSILREIGNNLGMTLAQVQLLLAIPFNSITMSNLSNTLGIDNSTLTRNLNKLEFQGYVNRQKDNFDKRVHKVSLAKKGQQTKEKIETKLSEYSYKLLSSLCHKDRQNVFESLEKLSWAFTKIKYS
jgi:DNA-binding MarR family transcriptional regulator